MSEAHGYGMLLTVMMADYDDQAQRIFDGMVRYFQDHPAASDPGLMAWNQTEGCGDSTDPFRGDVSATVLRRPGHRLRPAAGRPEMGQARAPLTIAARPTR